MGLAFILAPETFENGEPPPKFMGWIFVIVGSGVLLGGWMLAVLLIVAGRFLKRHKRRVFCMVVAGISCLFMPVGTVLGVFTIMLLSRPTVKAIFESTKTPV